jgi:restriction endonuclease S subunit
VDIGFSAIAMEEMRGVVYSYHIGKFGEMTVTFPKDPKEQSAIASVLSDMDADIETLERKRDKYKSLKTGIMQELLSGGIRLKIKAIIAITDQFLRYIECEMLKNIRRKNTNLRKII